MKKILSLLFPFFLLSSNFVFAEDDFSDIDGSIFRDAIEALHDLGIIEGYENAEFKPKQNINRAEFLKIVLYILDEDIENYEGNCFPDVQDQWFAPYVCKAKDLGIIGGYPDGYFRPEREVNMVEAMKMAINAYDIEIEPAKDGEDWYRPYVEFVHVNNIFSKYSYFPDRSARREETAFLVYKMLRINNGKEKIQNERYVGSVGCGLRKPELAISNFTVDGKARSAITIVPDYYKKDEAIPLIIAFHGRTSPNWEVREYYGLENAGMGAIFVYPEGLQSGGSFSWSDSGDDAGDLRDYEFFDQIVQQIASNYCVDMDQIYVVGHSLGGWFTNSLACARGDVIRAVGSLGGSRSNSKCTGPTAVMQWHNPNDRLATFESGVTAKDQALRQNLCSDNYAESEPAWGNCLSYQSCLEDAPVLWCPHTQNYSSFNGEYYPHNWPKGTGKEIVKFFQNLL